MEQGRANVYRGGGDDEGSDEEMNAGQVNEFKEVEATDDLLDEIDDVLEENAEEFVRAYVQKGGE
jgi:ubiquitin-like protein Pup